MGLVCISITNKEDKKCHLPKISLVVQIGEEI